MGRTGWLAVVLLALTAGGLIAARRWPATAAALDCAPQDVRWVDAGTVLIARCDPGGPPGPYPGGQARALGLKLHLNQASEEDIARLPGIGPVLGHRLAEGRAARGRYRSWDEVAQISGVGPAKLQILQSGADLGP